MSVNSSVNSPSLVSLSHYKNWIRYLILAATIATFILMVLGSIVRVSGAAQACPDWPTCYGALSLPAGYAARLQVAHRYLAAIAALLTFVAALAVLFRRSSKRWVALPLYLASAVVLFEVALGGAAALGQTPVLPLYQPLHMGLALLALGLLTVSCVAAFIFHADLAQPDRLGFRSPFSRLALASTLGIFVLMVSGAAVTALNAGQACAGWPFCSGGLPGSPEGWLALTHRIITLAVFILEAALFFHAWRSQRSQAVTLTAATGAFLLTLGQVLVGALKVERGFPLELVGLHAASAAALWAVQVVAVVSTGLAARFTQEEAAEASEPLPFGSRARDFLILNKPVIVLLLLVTTYAGMVVGGRRLPSLELTFWTLLGGALAAGGSSALNQYIDRETDRAMQRTASRPIPGGRLKPAEGLAYGLGACLAAFFLLAGFVNLLAAVLSLAGMVYYVLLYSILLKHATVQNIVIGGGAGAIPPLVGWAAAAGALNIPSLFLFAIIFFWTPPHFWALALVRKNDYARGKVPMLPVIKGEQETRKQVFIYTLELVGLTLLMPILHMAGSVYLVSALVLGAWLIHTAWTMLKKGGNKTAYTMYRYSSMYLAFLFLALVIDVLI